MCLQPADDPTDETYPHVYEHALDRVAIALGGKAVLPPAFQSQRIRGSPHFRSIVRIYFDLSSAHTNVFTQFNTALGVQRSGVAHRIRAVCVSTIFSCSGDQLVDDSARRASPRWAAMLGFDPQKRSYNPRPPLLYAEGESPAVYRFLRSYYLGLVRIIFHRVYA